MSVLSGILRLRAILFKEMIEMKRDYITYLFTILIPFAQAIFFGYIIDTDPKHLPTLIISNDKSTFAQNIVKGLENTGYFDIKKVAQSEADAEQSLKLNKIEFVINIPTNFSRELIRDLHPHILIEADATDPIAIVGAYQAANKLIPSILNRNLQGSLDYLLPQKNSFSLDLHSKYNPNIQAQYHSLPGLLAVILTSVLVMLTAVSMASEYEQGTFETLLATPVKPVDIILGKTIPHFIIGYSFYFLLIFSSYWLFHVPFYGSFLLLTLLTAPFILATLGVGFVISVAAKSQFEAATYANLYVLPSMLLSGFVFPFYGMPSFAQNIGALLPTTHYLHIVYNIMLKGSSFKDVWPDIWPIILFLIAIIGLCVGFYRRTLD